MKIAFFALILAGGAVLTGCPSKSMTQPPTTQNPPAGDPLFTADGRHFAKSRTYQGECMPAQSRGGCYSFTFEPDGTYRNVLLDAAVTGTYVIDGDRVDLKPDGDMPPASMTLSADRMKLDEYEYKAAEEPTEPIEP